MHTLEAQPVVHDTLVIERAYPQPPQRVFACFADPAKKRRWFVADGESQRLDGYEMDFRDGGSERYAMAFSAGHPLAGHSLQSENLYRNIVPDRRIVFTSTMAIDGKCISISLGTVELLPSAKGTDLILTFQSAFLEGSDGPQMRKAGWRSLLEKLADEASR